MSYRRRSALENLEELVGKSEQGEKMAEIYLGIGTLDVF